MAKKELGFIELDRKLDRVIDAMITREDLHQTEMRLERKLDQRIGEVFDAIDNVAKAIGDLTLEYAAVKTQLSRHDEWIRLIAKKAGVRLAI